MFVPSSEESVSRSYKYVRCSSLDDPFSVQFKSCFQIHRENFDRVPDAMPPVKWNVEC